MNAGSPLPLFNLAAVPADAARQADFFQAAEKAGAGDGYRLVPGKVLPHVTLCQFRAEDEAQALHLVSGMIGKTLALKTEGLCIARGEGRHAGKFWIHYNIERAKPLMDLQAQVIDILDLGAQAILTRSGDDYRPHLTLARLGQAPGQLDGALFDEKLARGTIDCRVRLGRSDENGQFLGYVDGIA